MGKMWHLGFLKVIHRKGDDTVPDMRMWRWPETRSGPTRTK